MDLHEWSLLPSLVIVDVSSIISSMQSLSLCAASFLDYLYAVSIQMEKQVHCGDVLPIVRGLFIVKVGDKHFNYSHLQLLKNLYFYKSGLFHGFEEFEIHSVQ